MTNFEYIPIPCRGGCRLVWFRPRLLFRVFVFKPYLTRKNHNFFDLVVVQCSYKMNCIQFSAEVVCVFKWSFFYTKKKSKRWKTKSINKWCIQKCKLHKYRNTDMITWNEQIKLKKRWEQWQWNLKLKGKTEYPMGASIKHCTLKILPIHHSCIGLWVKHF